MTLNHQQDRYLNFRLAGFSPTESAKKAEYTPKTNAQYRLEKLPEIIEALKDAQLETRAKSGFTREQGVEKLLKGVEIAIQKADPMGIARCINELNRMHGYLAPDKKEVIHSLPQLNTLRKLEAMSDEELMKMLPEEGMIVEGEFELVDKA